MVAHRLLGRFDHEIWLATHRENGADRSAGDSWLPPPPMGYPPDGCGLYPSSSAAPFLAYCRRRSRNHGHDDRCWGGAVFDGSAGTARIAAQPHQIGRASCRERATASEIV